MAQASAPPRQIEQPDQPQQPPHTQSAQRHLGPAYFPQQPDPFRFPPPPNLGIRPHGFPQGPPGPGFPGLPYGAPPGWFPPHGFHHGPPGHFPPPQMPPGPFNQNHRPQPMAMPKAPDGTGQSQPKAAAGDSSQSSAADPGATKPVATVKLPSASTTPGPPSNGPIRPPSAAGNSATQNAAPILQHDPSGAHSNARGAKNGKYIPVVPLASPAVKAEAMSNGVPKSGPANGVAPSLAKPNVSEAAPATSKTLEEANRDARAAVAAAMAKLPMANKQSQEGAIDHITNKISELSPSDETRPPRQPGTANYLNDNRGARGGNRRGRDQARWTDLPKSDYDFESANAKFNKQDLIKEAIATGSPAASPGESTVNGGHGEQESTDRKGSESTVRIPSGTSYDKTSSFFDDISSETKDRAQREEGGQRMGGREFRNEERQKNFETFGQGSVDNSYRRGGGRGRGRGRGGFRGGRGGRGGGRGDRRHGPVAALAVDG